MFESLNKRSTVCAGINTQDMEFAPLKDFCGQHFVCEGFFFTDGKYGEQVVVVGAGYLINMPKRAVEQFHKIEQDEDMVQAVLNHHLLITDIRMIDTRNGKTTAYTLADC
jgi:hypothetical protein